MRVAFVPRSTEVQPGFTRFDTLTPPTVFIYTHNPHFYLHTFPPQLFITCSRLVTYTYTLVIDTLLCTHICIYLLCLHLIHTLHTHYNHTGNTHTTTLFHLLVTCSPPLSTLSYTAIVPSVLVLSFSCSAIILLSYHPIISHCLPPVIHSLSFLKLIHPVTRSLGLKKRGHRSLVKHKQFQKSLEICDAVHTFYFDLNACPVAPAHSTNSRGRRQSRVEAQKKDLRVYFVCVCLGRFTKSRNLTTFGST